MLSVPTATAGSSVVVAVVGDPTLLRITLMEDGVNATTAVGAAARRTRREPVNLVISLLFLTDAATKYCVPMQ